MSERLGIFAAAWLNKSAGTNTTGSKSLTSENASHRSLIGFNLLDRGHILALMTSNDWHYFEPGKHRHDSDATFGNKFQTFTKDVWWGKLLCLLLFLIGKQQVQEESQEGANAVWCPGFRLRCGRHIQTKISYCHMLIFIIEFNIFSRIYNINIYEPGPRFPSPPPHPPWYGPPGPGAQTGWVGVLITIATSTNSTVVLFLL